MQKSNVFQHKVKKKVCFILTAKAATLDWYKLRSNCRKPIWHLGKTNRAEENV
jgi:hypothetical protein